jgi:hypothetical protein
MGKSTETQWIPSGSVLAVAIAAALVAVILVNVYVGYAKKDYERGSKQYYQLRDRVNKGQKIQERNLVAIVIPNKLVPAFDAAKIVPADSNGLVNVRDQQAPRDLAAGEFLFYSDFRTGGTADIKIPPGFELISLPVSQESNYGEQLQVGSYVNIRAQLDKNNDPKKPQDIQGYLILENMQIKSINGSVAKRTAKDQQAKEVQFLLKGAQMAEFDLIKRCFPKGGGKGFEISPVAEPPDVKQDGSVEAPEFSPEVRAFLKGKQQAAVKGGPSAAPPLALPGLPPVQE